MSVFEIGPVGQADSALLAQLHAGAFQEDPQAGEVWDAAAIGQILGLPGAFGLLAAQGPAPAGFLLARVAADEAEILALGVLPESRRRGAAAALLQAVRRQVATAGARRLFLEVAEDSPAACALYFSQGFQRVGSRPGYYRRVGGPPADAWILALPIDFV